LKQVLGEFKSIKANIPQPFEQLMVLHLNHLDQVLSPGCMTITWVSPTVATYIRMVNKTLESFHLAMSRADDIVKYRIELVLSEITDTVLCEINHDSPILIDEFFRQTEELCNRNSSSLQTKSKNVEDAVHELIEILYLVDDKDDLEEQGVNDDNADDQKQINLKASFCELSYFYRH
jgi:hypothetical protein